jgi:hypothetical protein
VLELEEQEQEGLEWVLDFQGGQDKMKDKMSEGKAEAMKFARTHLQVASQDLRGAECEFSANGVEVYSFTFSGGSEGRVVLAPGSNGRVTGENLNHYSEVHKGLGRRVFLTAALYTPHAGFAWTQSPIQKSQSNPFKSKGGLPAAYVGGKAQ